MTTPIFRWKAVAPLAAVLIILCGLWLLFGDWIVRMGIERAGSAVLGTEVDVAWLKVHALRARVEMGGLEIASPFDSTKDIVNAGTIVVDLAPAPLFEKKLVIDQLAVTGMRFGTTRAHPARPQRATNSTSAKLLAEAGSWAQSVKAPLLSLTPVDTIKSLMLEPSNLATMKAVDQLTHRADSVKSAFTRSVTDLQLQALADSTQALVKRLSAVKPGMSNLAATAQAAQDAKHGLDRINAARKQVAQLEASARAATTMLAAGARGVDSARQRDYDFARGLLKLPRIDASNIGAALFGGTAVKRFEQAVYWSRLAQQYVPPGLEPWHKSGPPRARMAGTTYVFPVAHTDPSFLLRRGDLSFALGGDTATSAFTGRVTGVTTQPALYGNPATLTASGGTTGAHALSATIGAVLDHTRSPVRDSARVRVQGIELAGIAMPGLPFSVEPGRGESELSLAITGSQLSGRWSLRSTEAAWRVDAAEGAKLSAMENVLWEVLSGLKTLDVTAEVSGELSSPQLSVSSNLDAAISDRLRAVAGAELAKAESKARAAVDKLVADKVDPAIEQATGVSGLVDQQLGGSKTQLDQLQKQLDAQLSRLGGAAGLLKLP